MLPSDVARKLWEAAEAARVAIGSDFGPEQIDFKAEVRVLLQPAVAAGTVAADYPDKVFAALLNFANSSDENSLGELLGWESERR